MSTDLHAIREDAARATTTREAITVLWRLADVLIAEREARRAVLAEITRDETADGVRADEFPEREATDEANHTPVVRSLPPQSDAQRADGSAEGRDVYGAQRGVYGLGDAIRDEAAEIRGMAHGEPYVVGVRPIDITGSADALTNLADRADALEADLAKAEARRDDAYRALDEIRPIVEDIDDDTLHDGTYAEILRHGIDRLTAERDQARRALETSWDIARQARVTADAIQQATRERAETAEATVERVRALLDRPLVPSALLLAALDGEGA